MTIQKHNRCFRISALGVRSLLAGICFTVQIPHSAIGQPSPHHPPGKDHLSRVPDVLFFEILPYCDSRACAMYRQTHRKGRQNVQNYLAKNHLFELDCAHLPSIAQFEQNGASCRYIRHLSLTHFQPQTLATLRSFFWEESERLLPAPHGAHEQANVSQDDQKQMWRFKTLQTLTLEGKGVLCSAITEILSNIPQEHALQSLILNLHNQDISPDDLGLLSTWTWLTALNLSKNPIKEEDLSPLSALENLTTLNLEDTHVMADKHSTLRNLPKPPLTSWGQEQNTDPSFVCHTTVGQLISLGFKERIIFEQFGSFPLPYLVVLTKIQITNTRTRFLTHTLK